MAKTTSYDKVSLHICQHPRFGVYLETLRSRLETLKLQMVKFEMNDGPNDIKVYYRVGYDGQKAIDWDGVRPGEQWTVPTNSFAFTSEMRSVVLELWDAKAIPTYNCKWDETKNGPRHQKCVSNHFPDYARDHIRSVLEENIRSASERVRDQIAKVHGSEDLENEKQQFVERTAIAEIKASLHKYRNLEERIIKTAFHEFVAEDVLSA